MTARLENWVVGMPDGHQRLNGDVFGDPRFQDGATITTSPISHVANGRVVTMSGSEYELGAPRKDYEAMFPNCKHRLLHGWPTGVFA